MRKTAAILIATLLSGGCCLVPRPEASAEAVFRNASGEAVELPAEWEWVP